MNESNCCVKRLGEPLNSKAIYMITLDFIASWLHEEFNEDRKAYKKISKLMHIMVEMNAETYKTLSKEDIELIERLAKEDKDHEQLLEVISNIKESIESDISMLYCNHDHKCNNEAKC